MKAPVFISMQTVSYDIIFTGGGAACRILLYFLSKKKEFHRLRILVIEAENIIPEKTWCYWGHSADPFQHLVCKQWSTLQFEADAHCHKQTIEPFSYACIQGADFDAFFTTSFFAEHKHISFLNEKVLGVKAVADEYIIETNSAVCKAPLVLNSIEALRNKSVPVTMWQHFEGWFIQTEQPCFKNDAATLMNFNDYNGGAFRFLYVLPFTNQEALIEYTFYSDELYSSAVYEEKIRQYLYDKNITAYTVLKKEKGKIPLQPQKKIDVTANGFIDIGTAGGLVKASTGYAFQRMLEDCREIVDSIGSLHGIQRRKRSRRFLFYDALLLRIIQEDPACAVRIFKQLFRKQPMHRILKFLNEDSSLLDEIKIFMGLPWFPFLRRIKWIA